MSDYWDKTIELYTDFIDYPQMVQKYLKRPPFKYIFQIFLSTNKKTKFADGLLEEEELSPSYYSSPEKKKVFLVKLFKFIYSVLDKKVPLKPHSIIKGVECDKTNEFLQDMHSVAVSGESFQSLRAQNLQEKKPDREDEVKPSKENVQEKEKKVNTPLKNKRGSDRKKDLRSGKKSGRKSRKGKVIKDVFKAVKAERKILNTLKPQNPSQTIKMGNIEIKNKGSKQNLDDNPQSNAQLSSLEIRQIIQKITQNSNPLGKLIEFIDDDLDSMNNESKKWKKIYLEATTNLEKLERKHDEELKSYYEKIAEIDEQIQTQKNKVLASKSRTLKNQTKIDKLLNNLL